MIPPDVIERPHDRRLIRKLEWKLTEYRARLQQLSEDRRFGRVDALNELLAPMGVEQISDDEAGISEGKRYQHQAWILDTQYKITLLRMILDIGKVRPMIVGELLRRRQPDFDPALYVQAAGVIDNYVQTGGKDIVGGTGLRNGFPPVSEN